MGLSNEQKLIVDAPSGNIQRSGRFGKNDRHDRKDRQKDP